MHNFRTYVSRKKILKYPLFWETSPGLAAFDVHGRSMYCTRLSRAAGYRDIDLLQMATCACNRYTWLTFRKLGECCSDEHRKQEEDSLHGGGRREAGGEPGLRSECRADWLAAVAAPFMYRGRGGGGAVDCSCPLPVYQDVSRRSSVGSCAGPRTSSQPGFTLHRHGRHRPQTTL